MVIDVKEEQEENAQYPIAVTLFGMVIEIKEEYPENALSPIAVISSEMMTVTSLSLISFNLIFVSPIPVNIRNVKGHS